MPKLKLETDQDDIRSILRKNGAQSLAVDRLGEVASEMCELEWKLVRRAASRGKASEPHTG